MLSSLGNVGKPPCAMLMDRNIGDPTLSRECGLSYTECWFRVNTSHTVWSDYYGSYSRIAVIAQIIRIHSDWMCWSRFPTLPRLDIIMVEVYTQLYASGAGFGFPPRMTANPLILYHLATLAWAHQEYRKLKILTFLGIKVSSRNTTRIDSRNVVRDH